MRSYMEKLKAPIATSIPVVTRPRPVDEPDIDPAKLFVTGIPVSVTHGRVRRMFEVEGAVVGLSMPQNPETGEHKGVAYITFTTPAEAAKAKDVLDGSYIDDSYLRISYCRRRPERRVRPEGRP